ncbi:uncharacterized protein LOC113239448 [Hyposmocoma kahamanoa]|uniref:uncharacterized protein LOC113239448 n=1 Tax=Hyposmocoma kahamanoa TaxID=1477025 RepID=UPI000E6D84DE|nr:uncharacterized protein LOC113239448 [Hyposmocoma kahamanoa]
MKSSPINGLQIECVDPPLYLRRQFLSDRFFIKAVQHASHPLLERLQMLSQATRESANYKTPCVLHSFNKFWKPSLPIEQFTRLPIFNNNFKSLTFKPEIILNFGINKDSPHASKLLKEKLATKYEGWLPIYTDASKLQEGGAVGSAVWIPAYKVLLNYKLPPLTSVFTGEAVSLLEAIQFAESHNLGHCGIPGNETADLCAKQAITSGSPTYDKVYHHDLLTLAHDHLLRSWQVDWQNTRNRAGKYYYEIQKCIPNKPWFFKQKLFSKQAVSIICRLRLGHACTPVHLAKIRIRDTSLCECGVEDGTTDHVLFNCPKLNISLYDLLPQDVPRPTNIKCILEMSKPSPFKILKKFLAINQLKL